MFYIIKTLVNTTINIIYFFCKCTFMIYVILEIVPKLTDRLNAQLKNTIVNIIHKTIYLYSKLQINFILLQNKCKPFTELVSYRLVKFIDLYKDLYEKNKKSTLNGNDTQIEFYDSGKFMIQYNVNNEILLDEQKCTNEMKRIGNILPYCYDYVIFTIKDGKDKDKEKDLKNNCFNKVCCKTLPNILCFEKTTIKFFMIKIKYYLDDKINYTKTEKNFEYTISLKNEHYDFYIVGNVLDAPFFKYYLMNLQSVPDYKITNKYNVELLDHNVETKIFNEKSFLIMNRDSYTITSINEENNYVNVTKNSLG